MKQLKKLFLAPVVIAGVAASTSAMAIDFSCTPAEVSVFPDRVHVSCSEPARDGADRIWFWVVPTANPQHVNRFLSTAATALVSGRKLILGFNPGRPGPPPPGEPPFVCNVDDCRVPFKITIR